MWSRASAEGLREAVWPGQSALRPGHGLIAVAQGRTVVVIKAVHPTVPPSHPAQGPRNRWTAPAQGHAVCKMGVIQPLVQPG